ncbi:MAG: hypothetical protein L3K07_00845 [Thermoplasmata archaeon]|nr:hypothetical protein [Thermoplasmata archaeon]
MVSHYGPGSDRTELTRRSRLSRFNLAIALGSGVSVVVALGLFFGTLGPFPSTQGGSGAATSPPPTPTPPPNSSGPGTPPPPGPTGPPARPSWCNSVSTPTPSALLIPVPNPSGFVAGGAQVSATYAYAIVNYSASDAGASLSFPSLFATFPMSSGGPLTIYFPPAAQNISGPGWWSPPSASQSVGVPATDSFGSGSALLSSEKLAVLGSSEYGNLTVEVRWHWAVYQPDAGGTVGGWSQPTSSAYWPAAVPSIFFPAPYVGLVRTTPNPALIGSEYSMWISGYVPGRSFFLEVEDPVTGQVSQAQAASPPETGPTPAEVQVLLLNYDSYLYPGTYLAHLHDACGALLYSVSVQTVYAASATVGFSASASSCGPVEFNHSAYAPGKSATVRPSETPFAFSAPSCPGFSLVGWTTSGGLHIVDSSHLLVSSSGSMSFRYQ